MCYFTAVAGTVGTSKSSLLQSPSYGAWSVRAGLGLSSLLQQLPEVSAWACLAAPPVFGIPSLLITSEWPTPVSIVPQ